MNFEVGDLIVGKKDKNPYNITTEKALCKILYIIGSDGINGCDIDGSIVMRDIDNILGDGDIIVRVINHIDRVVRKQFRVDSIHFEHFNINIHRQFNVGDLNV